MKMKYLKTKGVNIIQLGEDLRFEVLDVIVENGKKYYAVTFYSETQANTSATDVFFMQEVRRKLKKTVEPLEDTEVGRRIFEIFKEKNITKFDFVSGSDDSSK